jgi:hypothetical protein
VGFGQTSLSRGRVGGGAVQEHRPDGMIGGALPPPAVAVPAMVWCSRRAWREGFARARCEGDVAPAFVGRGRCSGARRCHAEIGGRGAACASDRFRSGLCDAGLAPDSGPGCW